MKKIAIVYASRTGNVEKMALMVAEGVREGGAEAVLMKAGKAEAEGLAGVDGLIAGSFTSYGQMASEMAEFFEESFAVHGKLQGKPAGAFASSGGLGGGNETTALSLAKALLVHGMMVLGDSESPHFGATCVGSPDPAALASCRKLGKRVAELAGRL